MGARSKSLDLARRAHREEYALRAHAEPVLVSPALGSPRRHEIVVERPLHQRPKIIANPNIRLEALRGAVLEPERMLVIGSHDVLDICAELQPPVVPFALDMHLDCEKWRVVNPHANLFDR